MNEKMFLKIRLYFTGIVTIAMWSLLAWNHFHSGVPSHHILANEDLPSISNWWGALLLPLLTWFLLYRIQKRINRTADGNTEASPYPLNVTYGFACSLLFGILLSFFFTFGYSDIPGYMLLGLLLLALFFPVYRAECILGFVIGMTFTFGAVLPTMVGSILALAGAALYLYIRPAILYVSASFLRLVSANKDKTTVKP